MSDVIDLSKVIPVGSENAISRSELARMLQTTPRHVSAIVSRLRQKGAIIAANGDESEGKCGYFQPVTIEELRRYVTVETKKIQTQAIALAAARTLLKSLGKDGNNAEDRQTTDY